MSAKATARDSDDEDLMDIRRATPDDVDAILRLGGRSLGWDRGDDDARLFAWKHFENPFGDSPMWLALIDGRLAGFRTFLRWKFIDERGTPFDAVRAVDTATDPDFQGRGVFTALTLGALDELKADGIDFVFNTPNDQSRPGYLKMGWTDVGRLPVAVRPTRVSALPTLLRARTPADRGALPSIAGEAASTAFDDHRPLEELLGSAAARPPGLSTPRSSPFLRWRYGLPSLHYRVLTPPGGLRDGFVVFHLRRRGPAVEAVVADVVVPGRGADVGTLLGRVAREAGADYLIRLDRRPVGPGPFVRTPGIGPRLTVREVRAAPPTDLAAWRLGMGDIELF